MNAKEKEKENGRETRTRSYAIAGIVAIAFALIAAIMVIPVAATTTTVSADKDCRISQYSPDSNYDHGSEYFYVKSNPDNNMRGLIQFDLSSIPSGATIDSATLHLYIKSVNADRTDNVHRITADWTETEVTWNSRDAGTPWATPGGDYFSTPTASTSTGTTADVWLQWDVKTDVQAFVSGTATNYGWLIKDAIEDAENKYVIYWSREYPDDTTKRPKLEVTYNGGGPTPDPNVTAITTPANIYANESNSINTTIKNNGIGDAGAFNVSLSADGTELEEVNVTAGLSAGASTEVSFEWTPSASGTYELCVVADCEGAVDESDETNNVTCEDVEVEEKPAAEPPHLVTYTISNRTITPPQTTAIDVEFSEEVEAWISIEDSDRNPVNELYHSPAVTNPASKTWDGTYENDTVVPAGDYYVNVTGTNTTTGLSVVNNTEVITVMSITEQPDLIVTAINTYHNNTGCSAWFNLSNEIDVTVKNNGTAPAGASNVSLYIEGDYGDTTMYYFGKLPVPDLGAGNSSTVTFTDWVPVGEDCLQPPCEFDWSYKDYNFTAVADCDNEVAESNETNNETTVVETACYNGYMADEPLENVAHGMLHGGLRFTTGDGTYTGLYSVGSTQTTNYGITLPAGATVELAHLNVYYTWHYEKESCPQMEVRITNATGTYVLPLKKAYNDIKCTCPGTAWVFPWGNYVYDLTDYITGSGTYTVTVESTGGPSFCVAAPGLAVLYEDANSPPIEYWLNDGADVLIGGRRSDGGYLAWWECMNNATFPASAETEEVVNATLGVVSPWAGSSWESGMTNYLLFNGVQLGTGVYHGFGETYDETIDSISMHIGSTNAQVGVNVTRVTALYLNDSENVVGQADDGDNMMPANAFLVVEYEEEAVVPWKGYLVPQNSTGSYCEDTAVELWVEYNDTSLTHGAIAYQVDVHFDPGCVNVTTANFSTSPFAAHMFTHIGPGVVRILEDNLGTMTPISSGTYKMATLTLHGESTSLCSCNLWFDYNLVSDTNGDPITNTYTDGTYTCAGVAEPDLIVTGITPNCGYLFANESNEISATIKNNGTADAGAFNVSFDVDGFSAKVSVGALGAGNDTEVSITDPTLRYAGATVSITVTADCDGAIAESNETNNASALTASVMNSGYKGKRYTGGEDIKTVQTDRLNGNLLYSVGDSKYLSGSATAWYTYTANWTASNLPVPGDASIEKARLYVMYTWDKVQGMPDNVSMKFNNNPKTRDAFYTDRKGYGSSNYPYGMLVYNVTGDFNRSGNTAALENLNPVAGNPSMRGMLLVVVYAEESEPERTIVVNEEFDLLYGGTAQCTTPEEATAYAPFGAIDLTGVEKATLITVAPGAGPDEGELLFNGQTWTDVWNYAGSSQIGINETDVTSYVNATGNEAGFQSSADYMEASNAFLVVEYEIPGAAPTADCFGVGDATGRSGTYVQVPVNITNVRNGPVQGIRLRIDYNESVLNLTSISNSDLTVNWTALQLGADRHTITIATAYTGDAIPDGSSGSVVLLNFHVIGSPGDTSPMNMTLIELSNPDGVVGTAPAKNGTFVVPTHGTIAGRITYTNNETGIAGAKINLTKESAVVNTTETNETGYYNFMDVIPDSYFVNASKQRFWDNSTEVTVIAGETATADMTLWLKGDLNNDGNVADAGDVVLMLRASVGDIPGDMRYDLNGNGEIGDAGDVVLILRASVGDIELL